MKKFWLFILAIVISFIPGVIGGFFSPMSPGADVWYNGLNHSVLTPNGWVFMIAWLILYTLLGISLFLVMNNEKTRQNKSGAYGLFIVQMILNAMWTYLFFGLQMIGAAFLVLAVLTIVAIWMAVVFKRFSRGAFYLVWPYIIWLCFALYLNGVILMLN